MSSRASAGVLIKRRSHWETSEAGIAFMVFRTAGVLPAS